MNIYKEQFKWLNENIDENNYISNMQYYLLKNNNINTTLDMCKKYIYYKEDNYNGWEIYNYYLSPIFLLLFPEELIPYIKWKINNIKQRI